MALRIVTLGSKFALTFFVTRYIGLKALGLYGLVLGATGLIPAILGLGMNGVILRHIVDMPLREALPHMFTRLMFNIILYALLIPLFILACGMNVIEIQPLQGLLIALIVFNENMATDIHGQLVSRHRIKLANILLFVRGGAWVFPFMLLGWMLPQYRTLNMLLLFWLASFAIVWGTLGVYLLREHRWHYLHLNWGWLRESIVHGRPFFLFDLGSVGSQYVDRFIVSGFLGLEITGVYTFFWSMANAVYSLVTFGIIQTHTPKMIGIHKRGDDKAFHQFARRFQWEVWGMSLSLALVLIGGFPWLIAFLHRPLLSLYTWAFGIIMLSTLIRLGADALNSILYARGKDKLLASIAVIGAVASALFSLAGAWISGFTGIVWGGLAAAVVVFALRLWYCLPLMKERQI